MTEKEVKSKKEELVEVKETSVEENKDKSVERRIKFEGVAENVGNAPSWSDSGNSNAKAITPSLEQVEIEAPRVTEVSRERKKSENRGETTVGGGLGEGQFSSYESNRSQNNRRQYQAKDSLTAPVLHRQAGIVQERRQDFGDPAARATARPPDTLQHDEKFYSPGEKADDLRPARRRSAL